MLSLRPPRTKTAPTPARAARRLWLAVLAGAVLPVLMLGALGGYALMLSRSLYEKRAELLTQNLCAALDRSVSVNVEKIDLALISIVDNLERQLADGRLDLSLSSIHIRTQIAKRAELDGIRVTDSRGIAILGPGLEGKSPVSFADREWFIAQRDNEQTGLFMSKPLVSKVTGEWIVSFSRRYRTPTGEFAGGVSAAVPLTYFSKELAAIDIGPHGAAVLRDDHLRMITRYPPPAKKDVSVVGSTTVSAELRELVESGRDQATFHAKVTADNIERTTTFHRLKGVPMLVIVGLGTEDYLADWYGEVRRVTLVCLGILALYGAGAFLLLRALRQNRQARQRIDLLANVFEHSGEAIMMTDRDNRIIEVNPAFVRQTGYSPEEVIGREPKMLASGRTTDAEYEAMWAALRTNGFWRGELWDRTKQGREYPKWLSLSAVFDDDGEIRHHIASSIDVTDVKLAEDKMLHLAHHDALTQLPNRVHLHGRLEQAIASMRREGGKLAMLFIDMDRFKNINDTLGHHIGDGLLVQVGQRLRGLVRDSDIVARLGGDEFVIVLTGISGDGSRVAQTVARKVVAMLGQPYVVNGHELHSTPSIGIGIFPADGEDADTLMKNADTAMYHAKATGRNNFQFFTAAMNEAAAERSTLEHGLRSAIERNELFLHYQPQIDLASGRVVGLEALVRWNHPEVGLIPPLKFIPIAEDTGQIEAIGAWVLNEALGQIARWRAAGWPDLRVAVNLSAQQLRADSFKALVAQALQRHDLPGKALELEITESIAMRNPAQTATMLRQLRDQGVALAIDDFGTGYSSLAYLKQLPLSCLKLDRSFVTDVDRDSNNAAICTATIHMAHSLGLAVVAEGVETAAQLARLVQLGCDIAQGYHIGRPIAADECERFLRNSQVRERSTEDFLTT